MMRMRTVLVTATMGLLSGCAPVQSRHLQDDWVSARTVVGQGREEVASATVETGPEGAVVTVQSHQICKKEIKDEFHRTRFTERHADLTTTWLLYGIGGLGAVLGTFVLVDAPKVPGSGDPATTNAIGRPGAYAIGAALLTLGSVLLGTAVGTSLRARDETDDLGKVTVARAGSETLVSCKVKPVAERQVVLTGALSVDVPLGRTDRTGRLQVKWDGLESLFTRQEFPTSGTIEVNRLEVGRLNLSRARVYWATRALAVANRLASEDKVEEATEQARMAEALGADVIGVNAEIASAPSNVKRRMEQEQRVTVAANARRQQASQHLGAAKTLMYRSKLDAAKGELGKAKELGADVDELETTLANLAAARAVSLWKQHIAGCRKVSQTRSAIDRLAHCDSNCERIRSQANKDWERLGQEKMDGDGVPEAQIQLLSEMCERAGCPGCPGEVP